MLNTNGYQSLAFAVGVSISVGAWATGDGLELKSATDRTSYALGYQIGGDFERMQTDLNRAAIVRGIADAQSGAAPLMSDETMRSTLIELKRKVVAQERAPMPQIDKSAGPTAPAEADKAAPATNRARRAAAKTTESAKEFLQKNAQQPGVVTLTSGLQYRVLKNGTGKAPAAEDKVALIYRGAFANGNEFGSTEEDGKPVPKTFAVASLVPGMREAVSHMKEGDQWQVFIPPQLGFDASTPLYRKITVFDVQLVAVNP